MTNLEHFPYEAGWINTASGKQVFCLAPAIKDFDIEDQAHSLSRIHRYAGHMQEAYTVCDHACILSDYIVTFIEQNGITKKYPDAVYRMMALTHDNAEAYLGDIVKPLKRLAQFQFINELEKKYDELLAQWIGIPCYDDVIKALDYEMVRYETVLFKRIHPDWVLPRRSVDHHTQEEIIHAVKLRAKYSTEEKFIRYMNKFNYLKEEISNG